MVESQVFNKLNLNLRKLETYSNCKCYLHTTGLLELISGAHTTFSMFSVVRSLKPSEDRPYFFGMSRECSGDKCVEFPAVEYHLGQSSKVSGVISWYCLKISSESHSKNADSNSTVTSKHVLSLKLATREITLFHVSIPLNRLFGPFA